MTEATCTNTAIPLTHEPCASTDPTHAFDHAAIEDAAFVIEALSDLLRVVVVDVEPGMDGYRPRVVSNRLTSEQGVLLRRVLNGRSEVPG